jgi:capsular polysaccharide biosynthesis protein
MGKLGGSLLSKASSLEDVFIAILQSRTMQLSIIQQFNLVHEYKFDKEKEYFIEDVCRALDKNMHVVVTEQGTLDISFKDKSPQKAADMANFATQRLDEVYRRISTESVRNKRIFLDDRLKLSLYDLDSCEDRFVAFQKRNKVFDIEAQTKATVDEGAVLEGQYLAEQLRSKLSRNIYMPDDPKEKEQERILSALRAQRDDLASVRVSNIMIPLKLAPDLGMEFVRLKRDLQIQEVLHSLILQQFELAKMEEAKQTPRIQILDNAMAPQKRAKPKRTRFVLIAFCLSIVVGLVLVKVVDTIRDLRSSRSTAYQKVVAILANIGMRRQASHSLNRT